MRITLEMIQQAYKETKLKPCNCWTYGIFTKCGCPLTAIYLQEGNRFPFFSTELGKTERLAVWAAQRFGGVYAHGFVNGVDNRIPHQTNNEDYINGYNDGNSIGWALFGEYWGRRNSKLLLKK